jgi:hypothetical protein
MGRCARRAGDQGWRAIAICTVAVVLSLVLSGCSDDDDHRPRRTPTATISPTTSPTAIRTQSPSPTPTATGVGNQAPVLAPLGDHTVVFGSDLLIPVTASDPEGSPVTLSASGLPDNSYFLSDSGVFCLLADLEEQIDQPFQVTFTASDGAASSSETVTIVVVRGGLAAVAGLAERKDLVLAPIGDQSVRAGDTLTVQLSASGPSPIIYRMFPDPAIASQVTLDANTGLFTFAPTDAQIHQSFEITFQACVPDGADCSATAQVHETIHIEVGPPPGGSITCPDYVPSNCLELSSAGQLPQPVRGCYFIKKGGAQPWIFNDVNILDKGALYFVEDPDNTIDVRFHSVLVELGGVLQAGSPDCPFGQQASLQKKAGGKLSIGLYGEDLSKENTVPTPTPGIQCLTGCEPNDLNLCSTTRCFTRQRDFIPNKYYCVNKNSDDPCFNTTAPDAPCAGFPPTPTPSATVGARTPTPVGLCAPNYLQENYHNLNFDNTPWGYKVLGVSYGGALRLFGYKGAKPLQDKNWKFDSNDHCVAPTTQQSTLDKVEMQAWADLTGNSWARLSDVTQDRTKITLDRNVEADTTKSDVGTDWTPGDQIVVGTTDWYPSHSELRTIRSVSTVSTADGMATQLTLCRPCDSVTTDCDGKGPGGCHASARTLDALDYPHNAKVFNTNDLGVTFVGEVNRKAADLRASVGLLSRSIQIRSLGKDAMSEFPSVKDCTSDKTKPECYFGGHMIVRQAFRDVQIQGVEFKQLGQGGRMGHYPVHFHLAKNTDYTQGKAFVKDSSIWDSMNRFVNLHGTHGVTVARNVGYLSVGDGYMLEDGSEIQNKFCHNLGVGARGSLKEYFDAQAKLTPLPITARSVPPILDGTLLVPNPPDTEPNRPLRLTGSDTYMPVMYWFMNAYNELVGNNAVGVHGFGSCYWLLGSGLSGHSYQMRTGFAGLANYNDVVKGYQAPLLRFRGNSCMTSPLALPASAELPPAQATIATEDTVGYHALPNPYIAGKATYKDLNGQYTRPAVNGDFKPIQPNFAGPMGSFVTNCAQTAQVGTPDLSRNTQTCVTTVIDRFSTSYNWAEVNFGSIWFRPWFYLFLNSAMTDQLFGGLTFVTAGSWMQVPPAYFSLAKNSLFVGTSQSGPTASQFAKRSGPIFKITNNDSVVNFAPCVGPKQTCNIEAEGTGYWRDFFQPKRLITIYDGPHFADGNTFVNVGSWKCNPQPCAGKANCDAEFDCGIYSSTVQPAVTNNGQVDKTMMEVIDAAIGWKQPNGFYYPPAFAYRKSNFVKTLGDMPAGVKELNQCFSYGPQDDFKEPTPRAGSCRHNVIDRTRAYIKGNLISPNAQPQIIGPGGDLPQPVTPIDFSTILLDIDGSLTGAKGSLSGQEVATSSISRNPFFDAPSQSPECLSFGLQTSPFQFVTTMVAPLAKSPALGDTNVQPWTTFICKNGYDDNMCPCPPPPPPPTPSPTPNPVFSSPLVPIYRQWRFPGEPVECGAICSATGQYNCDRGTFMIGPDVGHATYLTMAQPQALMPNAQPGALYYIDTNSGGNGVTKPDISCIKARTCVERPPTFLGSKSYVVYDLFARNDSKISYQFYVGPGSTPTSLAARYVHVTPHEHTGVSFESSVRDACVPGGGTAWCKDLPVPTVDSNGVLTVVLDQSKIKDDYQISQRPDYERCMPRNFCYFDSTAKQCKPCTKDNANCIGQADRLQSDIDALSHVDANMENPANVICQDWGGFASGTTTNTLGERSFVDCPASGCLGLAFTLPQNFSSKPYNEVGATQSHCFDRNAWQDDALVALTKNDKLVDPLCGSPRTPKPSDYCDDPGRKTATATSTRTPGAGTPTSTPTGPVGPTNTATRSRTATVSATPTRSGAATATATITGQATPTGTPTITPTPPGPTPTHTPVLPTATNTPVRPTPTDTPLGATPTATATAPVGGFSWLLNGTPTSKLQLNLDAGGSSYGPGQLFLVDGQARFCTAPGTFPTLRVDIAGQPIVGAFPMNTTSQVGIAHIPGQTTAGTADLLVETRVPCTAQPMMIRFSGAITYGP